ncbi:MAG: insulinase family protein, partial [candidate division Zixibacteria bacterium]
MKRFTLVTFTALMTLTFVLGSMGAAQDISQIKYPKLNPLEIPNVKKIELDNGLRLYLSQDKSLPIFRASVRINIGSYLEPADKIGLADVTSSVLRTGGTKKW